MTWTHTSRGRALDLINPQPDDVDLDEVARSLGNQCRYNGCVRRFYSVAEHSVLIARWLRDQGESPEVVLGGLLHDGAEAYTGDITWPVQAVLFAPLGGPQGVASNTVRDRYKVIQARLDDLIANAAGLNANWLHVQAVKTADLRILLDERAVLLTEPPPLPWAVEAELGLRPLGVEIRCWSPEEAARVFGEELSRSMQEVTRG